MDLILPIFCNVFVILFTVIYNISELYYQDNRLIQDQNLHNSENTFLEKKFSLLWGECGTFLGENDQRNLKCNG
jgi:hypothetical protein